MNYVTCEIKLFFLILLFSKETIAIIDCVVGLAFFFGGGGGGGFASLQVFFALTQTSV